MWDNGQKIRRLRKGRCVALLLVLILLTMLLAAGFPKAKAAEEGRPLQAVVVVEGDNLWNLVQKHYKYRGDIRKAIYEVMQINSLQYAVIIPGQVLYIPQY